MRARHLTTDQLVEELKRYAKVEAGTNGYPLVLLEAAGTLLEQLNAGERTAQQVADEWVRENERWNRRYLQIGVFPPVRLPQRRPRPILIVDAPLERTR